MVKRPVPAFTIDDHTMSLTALVNSVSDYIKSA